MSLGFSINAASVVIGVIAENPEYSVNLLMIKNLSRRFPVSKSKPPRLIRFPAEYRKPKVPSLFETVADSSASASKLSFLSINISAERI